MRGKVFLAAFLLGAGLCFVPVLGYGEVKEWMYESKVSLMDLKLLDARVDYVMSKPENYLWIYFLYDPVGEIGRRYFPRGVDTEGKIVVKIQDNRGAFSYKSGRALLRRFKRELEDIYLHSSMELYATDMDTDIVARFLSGEGIPLGYFYQGEYHLWEE